MDTTERADPLAALAPGHHVGVAVELTQLQGGARHRPPAEAAALACAVHSFSPFKGVSGGFG